MSTKRPSIHEGSEHEDVRASKASEEPLDDDAPSASAAGKKAVSAQVEGDISVSNDSIHLDDVPKDRPNARQAATQAATPANAPTSNRASGPSSEEDLGEATVSDVPHGGNETDEGAQGAAPKAHKASKKEFTLPRGASHRNMEPSLRQRDFAPSEGDVQFKHDGMDRVRYLNGERLSRPLSMPNKYKRLSYILVLIAVAIGVAFLAYYFDTTVNAPIRERQQMQQRINEDIPLDLPPMVQLLPMDDASIIATVEADGSTIFNKSAMQEGTSTLELIKLPSDVDLAEAAALYMKGINKLSGIEAATLLNGSWDLDVDRSKGMNMAIHYADFRSGSVDSAIQNALVSEGLDQTELSESGVDGSGNTFSTGNVSVGGITYAWKISALPLSEIYSINGLPENAVYVGIRFTS